MNIDVNTKKMAVIGDPIEHSLSPLMHNSIIQANGFNAVYFPFHVKPSDSAGTQNLCEIWNSPVLTPPCLINRRCCRSSMRSMGRRRAISRSIR